jgi:hypothetical protein
MSAHSLYIMSLVVQPAIGHDPEPVPSVSQHHNALLIPRLYPASSITSPLWKRFIDYRYVEGEPG